MNSNKKPHASDSRVRIAHTEVHDDKHFETTYKSLYNLGGQGQRFRKSEGNLLRNTLKQRSNATPKEVGYPRVYLTHHPYII